MDACENSTNPVSNHLGEVAGMVRLVFKPNADLKVTKETVPVPDEQAAIETYKSGDPEYQPSVSREELMKELGIIK